MISKIYHISDLHIKNFKRHGEYNVVFDRLFKYIESTKDSDSVIILAGDIVHSKTDMSPELVSMVFKFFKKCADLLPTILIQGNHDSNLRSLNRMDALTPIVESMDHPNLHYWKYSGVHRLKGVVFSVLSIADKRENWVLASDIPDAYKIALYHGPIMGSTNDAGTLVGTYGISVDIFEGFDLGICGDIHKFQYMNREKTIGYSSSLVGQNYAEHPTRHGIIVWKLSDKSSEFVRIPNDHAYVTFLVDSGECDIPNGLPPNIRARIQHRNSSAVQVQAVIDRLTAKYNVIECIKQKVNINNNPMTSGDNVLGNSRDVEYQNALIGEYLTSIEPSITDAELLEIYKLNADTNRSINLKPVLRNTIWKPKKMEFSNMFSYGEDNVIDFSELDGLYGIFAGNYSGKSSLFHSLCFALYDKAPITTKSSHVLNINKDRFYCKLQFEMNGTDYFIERIGIKKPDGNVRVDVNFWWVDSEGHEISLNGEDRDKTNYMIREYVGQYEDFLMTALSTQYDNQSFVEKSQKERKELLYKFLDISIYDDLYKFSKETAKEYQILIRNYERDDLPNRISLLRSDILEKSSWVDKLNSSLAQLKTSKETRTEQLFSLNKDYVPVDSTLNREFIDQNIARFESQIEQSKIEIGDIKSKISNNRELIRQIKKTIVPVSGKLPELLNEFAGIESDIQGVRSKLGSINREIEHCLTAKSQLSAHEYDPNCRFCVNNEFVKDANRLISLLPSLRDEQYLADQQLLGLTYKLDMFRPTVDAAKLNEIAAVKLRSLDSELELLRHQHENAKYKMKAAGDQLKVQKRRLAQYERDQQQIERNIAIQRSIQKITDELQIIDKNEVDMVNKYKARFADLERTKVEYEDCLSKLNSYTDCLKKYRIYELYLRAMSREGIPYKILQAVLPVIENEVNVILQQIVDFTVRLDSADEKYIHAYIVHGEVQSWPVELSSGMERFILSLAFRQALSEITSLPKANFLAIDEGFGVLDSENLMSIGRLLNYLKSQYDYLLIISHIDAMRDLVDKQIRVDKIDGYSRVAI